MCAVSGLTGVATAVQAGGATAKGKYIVVLKDGVTDPGAVAKGQAAKYDGTVGFVYSHALKGYSVTMPVVDVPLVEADPRVISISPDLTVSTSDPSPSPLPQQAQVAMNFVTRIGADVSTARSGDGSGSVAVNVAVLDTGIDPTHPDLNVIGGVNCLNDGKSFADDYYHGTEVAGVLAAKDNGIGVVGVAPGARLWAVKVLNKRGMGAWSQVLCGVDWITGTRMDSDPTNDIAVANMSIGSQASSNDSGTTCSAPKVEAVHSAVCRATASGIVIVVGAGNDSQDVAKDKPAAYDEVLTATAITDTDGQPGGLGPVSWCLPSYTDDTPAAFSNFAVDPADQVHTVAAPGNCVGSTLPGGLYGSDSGTSFASPMVAGVVALCIANGPCAGLTAPQIIQKIVADAAAYNTANPGYGFTGDPQHPIAGKYYGNLIRAALY